MLSIVVSWKNRKELNQAMPSLLSTAALMNGEIIIVNFDGDAALFREVAPPSHSSVRVVEVKNQPMFNKAACNNIGAHHAKHGYLFFCDCDIILEPESIKALFQQLNETPESFGTLVGVKETIVNSIQNNHIVSFGYNLIIKTKDGRTLQIIDSEEDANDGTRNAPGLLMTSKANFERINGYNSNLVGWGWEDQDMIGRLTLGAGLERKFHGKALHISHNDEERTKHYPIANRWESRDKMFRQALANYDANKFSGTYSSDIANYQFS
jgi:predicted glycosyltransferase involved in capsule biosynthesis